jgi:hypothetical protein
MIATLAAKMMAFWFLFILCQSHHGCHFSFDFISIMTFISMFCSDVLIFCFDQSFNSMIETKPCFVSILAFNSILACFQFESWLSFDAFSLNHGFSFIGFISFISIMAIFSISFPSLLSFDHGLSF